MSLVASRPWQSFGLLFCCHFWGHIISLMAQLSRKVHFTEQQNIRLTEQKEKQEMVAQLAELQTTILRSQMNSHFVFNVLNSIKLFILENKPEKAVAYLNSFARFIRKILDSSIDDSSTLKEELDTIGLYLSIESTRLSGNFTYNLDADQAIKTETLIFPALLLQPFVENALWHGLMNSANEKHLNIAIYGEEKCIYIDIDDNGIGLQKSKELKAAEDRKSHGLEITERRIREFNMNSKCRIEYSIREKVKELEGPGTKVEIRYFTDYKQSDFN